MIPSIKKHIATLFLVTSTLVALPSDPTQDPSSSSVSGAVPSVEASYFGNEVMNTLMGMEIAKLLPRVPHLAIVCSAGREGNKIVYEMLALNLSLSQLQHYYENLNDKTLKYTSVPNNQENLKVRFLDGVQCFYIDYDVCMNADALKCLNFFLLYDKSEEQIQDQIEQRVEVQGISLNIKIPENVTSIEDNFLFGCTGLTTVDLSPLSKVTSIGNGFLADCIGLTALDLSPLSKMTKIQDQFLLCCYGLTTLDLSVFSNVTSIGTGFLSHCYRLATVDLSPLSNVTNIGNHFLFSCTGLRTLDLSPLSNVTSIRNFFLSGCSGLTTVDLSPLSNVTSIEYKFLSGCSGLTTLDLLPLSNTGFIWDFFLSGCSGLSKLDLSPLSKMNNILDSFIHAYSSLTRLDLSRLPNVTNIGDSFLVGCTGLENLTVSAESPLAKQITEGQKNGQISSSLEIQLVVG